MDQNTNLKHNDSGLEIIIEAAEQFERECFLEGIRRGRFSVEEIQKMTGKVNIFRVLMEAEGMRLASLSEQFLNDYAKDESNCFETGERLFRRLLSAISASRKEFKLTCPVIRQRLPENSGHSEQPVSLPARVRSVLSTKPINMGLFGIKSHDDAVQELYESLKSFFAAVILNLSLCHRVLRDERMIMSDAERCKAIYDNCVRKVMSTAWEIKRSMEGVSVGPVSELYERKRAARSNLDFFRNNYHKYTKGQFIMALVVEMMQNGYSQGLTDEEMLLWPNNPDKVMQVREAIGLLDSMERLKGNKDKWDSRIIVYFLKWCGVGECNEKRLYEHYLCPEYKKRGGRLTPVGWNAIYTERNNLRKQKSNEDSWANIFEDLFQNAKSKRSQSDENNSLLSVVNL